MQQYSPKLEEFALELDDCLNFYETEINLLHMPGHYRVLYSKDELERFPSLNFDTSMRKEEMKKMNEVHKNSTDEISIKIEEEKKSVKVDKGNSI